MKETGWEGCADRILELHRQGPGAVPAAREAVAQIATEGERLISLVHGAGPNKVAPKCIGCLGKTTACECADDPECQYGPLATVHKLQEILDNAWAGAHAGKKPGENRVI
jgi:hypothetical protein